MESSKVCKYHALSCKVQFATPVCACALLLTSFVPGLLSQGWVSGRRSLNKLPSELAFSKGGSNTIWGDHNKACILGLFIALLCSSNLTVKMVFLTLGCVIMLLQSQILRTLHPVTQKYGVWLLERFSSLFKVPASKIIIIRRRRRRFVYKLCTGTKRKACGLFVELFKRWCAACAGCVALGSGDPGKFLMTWK